MIKIASDLKKLEKKLTQIERKQLPYAASVALNETIKDVEKGLKRQLKKDIDRPTPFTLKAFRIKRSTKRNLVAEISIKPIQAKYLGYQIDGGTRRAKRAAPVIIPREKQRNKYGNLPRGKLRRLAGRGSLVVKNGFVGQKMARKIKPIAYLADKATYKKRFKFYERAKKTTRATLPRRLGASIRRALSTAK